MPEGDTVAGHVLRLRPVLVGRRVQSVAGSAPSLRAGSRRLVGQRVEAVHSTGKNLVIDLTGGTSILVHLGMTGGWRVLDADRRVPGAARLALTTSTHHVVCLAAPTVIVDRSSLIESRLASLGPDVVAEEWDETEFVRRARTRDPLPIAAMLLDQRVAAGIGNVFKSELLFLEGVHPDTRVSQLTDEGLAELGRRARRLVLANVGRSRSTTAERSRGRETWVYGREGKPCRRCSTAVERGPRQGRVTYWCPVCQPPPA